MTLAEVLQALTLAWVPRFRLPAPLRGSTPRQLLILTSTLARWRRSAQNDTEKSRVVGYNLKVDKVTLVRYLYTVTL